ncbi:MAG: hypothetical protein LBC39_08405 [Methanobrevibacter sp.]|jgi:hypothetical protein|nr:hypothetical protein [Candidatus Methanovirga aequatorialis]
MTTVLKEIKINVELLKAIEKRAKNENTTEDKIFNEVIEKGLEKKEPEIPEHLILNKDTYNPDHKRLMSMAGIAKYGKPFSAVKLVREMREGGHDIP